MWKVFVCMAAWVGGLLLGWHLIGWWGCGPGCCLGWWLATKIVRL